jgi:hypothetical protein
MIISCFSTNGVNLDDNIIVVRPLNLLLFVENIASFQKLAAPLKFIWLVFFKQSYIPM